MELKFIDLLNNDKTSINFIKRLKSAVVYRFLNIKTNKCYIGVAKNLEWRLYNNFYGYTKIILREVKSKIHKALKESPEDFILIIEYKGTSSECYEMEPKLILKYDSYLNGYNSTIDGSGIFNTTNYSTYGSRFKGHGVWVNNGEKNIMIFDNQLEDYINSGYSKGLIIGKSKPNGNLGKVFMTDGIRSIKVNPCEVNELLNEGWRLGRTFKRIDLSNKTKGKVYVTNGYQNKPIFNDEIDKYINNGWKLGKTLDICGKYVGVNDGINNFRISKDKLDEFLSNPGNSKGWITNNKKKYWVNNGIVENLIDEESLSDYLNNGYKRGKLPLLKSRGRIRINNGVRNTTIDKSELDKYLLDGWVMGMKPRK